MFVGVELRAGEERRGSGAVARANRKVKVSVSGGC